MKSLISCFIAVVFCCGDVYSVHFHSALRFSDQSMELIHKCAVDVDKDESINLQPLGKTEGKYADFEKFVVFSFPSEIYDDLVDEVTKLVREKFSERSLIFTGYHHGANYAAKIADLLSSNLGFMRNQTKLITFCPADRISESFDRLSLVNRLNFSHAFEKVDFYGSNMIEIPMLKISEIKSRVNMKDAVAQCVGWGLLGLSWISDFHSTLSFATGIGLIGVDVCLVAHRKLQYLPVSGVVEAYRRAVHRSWAAEFESEWKTLGRYSFF